MALKFKCRECGEYIITKFLKVSEVAKCLNCGAENVVPENALEADEEPKDIIPTGTKPETAVKIKGKGKDRSFGSVVILSIITLSIYFWVYFFKTLREMKNSFSFDAQETNPDKVRPILIVWLIVSIVFLVIPEALGYPSQFIGNAPKTMGFYIWWVSDMIISTALFIAFWSSFVKLIETCQKKGGMVSLNKTTFWTWIAVNAVVGFASIGATWGAYIALVTVVSLLVGLVLLYLTVKQVNRVWTESHGIS